MKIAVTSQNFRTITPHAGRTRRFLVYEAAVEGGEPVELARLDLPQDMAMHDFRGDGPHPLDAMDVVIAGSFGEGFAARMASRGITVVATGLTDPLAAVNDVLTRLRAGDQAFLGAACGHGHSHSHGHGHHHAHRHAHGHQHGAARHQRGQAMIEETSPAGEKPHD
jgi:predicted Fe-Mo cluster-binding NifX family protein